MDADSGSMENSTIPSWDHARKLIAANQLARVNHSSQPPTWLAPSQMVTNFRAMSLAENAQLLILYKASTKRFSPLADPLSIVFPLNRQLSDSREEVYSDWLQWVLQQIADPRLIGQLVKSKRLEKTEGQIEVTRETVVEHGHEDQGGRLDIVIKQGARWLAVIEVKTRPYTDADLRKHTGYRACAQGADLIFVAIDITESDLFDFRFLSWSEVCVALRGIAPLLLRSKRFLSAALILSFVGAVEQNLLGFVSPETPPIPIGKIPRMVEHLTKAAQAEQRYGNP